MRKATARTRVTALAALIAVVSASAPAFSQDTRQAARCANAPADSQDTTYCFEPEIVRGAIVGAEGQGTRVLRPFHGPSLLRIRAHFVPEMLKSVERI